MKKWLGLVLLPLSVVSCSDGSADGSGGAGAAKTDAELRDEAVTGMHDALLHDLGELVTQSTALCEAAPTPTGRGWDATLDADAFARMKTSWTKARTAYEQIEGALAPIFPNVDHSIDARYDDFLADLSPNGDPDPFDAAGATGLHAVERVLYADVVPANVVALEASLEGYRAARFPATDAEAASFKNGLCAKLVTDATALRDEWTPANVDVAVAYQGLVSLMNEQREKVQKASSGEEESRYSQRTMADIRDNLSGTRTVYAIFKPWIRSKVNASDPSKDGVKIDEAIEAGFASIDAAYQKVDGDAIPAPPATWSAESPSDADLMTPFGQLFSKVNDSVDPEKSDSVVTQMNAAADLLDFPELSK